jgi:hypothetical protein
MRSRAAILSKLPNEWVARSLGKDVLEEATTAADAAMSLEKQLPRIFLNIFTVQ